MATALPSPRDVAAHVPGARAAVLARLWGAFAREPIEGVSRQRAGDRWLVRIDGHEVRGDAAAAEPFAVADAGWAVHLDGAARTDPGGLIRSLLARRPGAEPALDHEAVARFADELDNSVRNLALARAAQPPPDGGEPFLSRLARMATPAGLAAAEQAVVDGHPLHPLCRTRMGLSTEEVHAYAPEHRGVVELIRVTPPPGRWATTGTGSDELLLHPWQFHRWADELRLTPVGDNVPALPLMSLRTLAPLDRPEVHIKTAVDIQMTSAVRQVSPAALRNGPLLSGLLAPLGRRCGLVVLTELAGAGVLDPATGLADRRLAMLVRQAPRPEPGEVVLPLAALSAPSPADGRPILAEAVGAGDPLDFLAAVADTVIPPALAMLAAGVALEAHGQNTLLGLENGRPTRLFYRDFGGIRVSAARLTASGWPAPALSGDLPTDEPEALRTKLFAALFGTVLPELVDTVSRTYGVDPADAWAAIAATIGRGPACADRTALLGHPVPVKATTAMRLAKDPLTDIWCRLDNPMARYA